MICALTLEQDVPTPLSWSGKEPPMLAELTAQTDGELALAWRSGRQEALRVLVDRHRGAAFGLALRLCGNRDAAEDLAQEAFLRALSRLHQYKPREPFRPWLLRILAHLYIDDLRRHRIYQREEIEPPPRQTDTTSSLFVHAVLSAMPEQHRTILILAELVGLSYEEMASAYHIPVGTVRSRLAHARAAFRTRYLAMEGEVRS